MYVYTTYSALHLFSRAVVAHAVSFIASHSHEVVLSAAPCLGGGGGGWCQYRMDERTVLYMNYTPECNDVG